MTGIVKLYDLLVSEYDRTQNELNEVDRNLRKLSGSKDNVIEPKNKIPMVSDKGRKRKLSDTSYRRNGIFKNDEDTEKNSKKPTLPSTIANVSPALASSTTDKQMIVKKPADTKGLARNRRMFGMIMGTLQKFQTEESSRKDIMTKREQIERKVEEAAEKEKIVLKKEKDELRKNMRQKKTELRKIELKIERVKIHNEWEKSMQNIGNFIQTKTKPSIFYCPGKHTPETEKKMKDSKDKLKIILAERRVKVQKELAEIDELYRKDIDYEEDNRLEKNDNKNHNIVESMDEKLNAKTVEETDFNEKVCLTTLNANGDQEMNGNSDKFQKYNDNLLIDSKTSVFTTKKEDKEDILNLDTDDFDKSKVKEEGLEEKEFEPIYDE